MTRQFAAILTHAFFLQVAAYIVRPTSAYRAMELGVSPALVGLIAASFAIVPLILAVFVGRWNDKGRQLPSMLWGAVIMVGAGFGLLASESMASLLLWNAVIGLGHLMSVLGEQGLVARANRSSLDAAFGTYTFAGSLGQAAAPAILGAVGGSAVLPDSQALFLIYVGACIVMLPVTLALGRVGGHIPTPAQRPSFGEALRVSGTTKRTMTGALLLSMLVLAAVDLIQVYLPALGVERHLSTWTIGALLTVRAGATMISRLGLSRLTHAVGRNRLVTVSSVVAGCAVAIIAAPIVPVGLAVVLAVAGFALGIGQPLSMSIVALTAPRGTTSTWLALRLSANRFGQSAIPTGLSALAVGIGTSGIFVVTGVMLFATAVMAHALLPGDD